jgi:GntR family transcriptional repressor for pyruvate dehydrogenase complex
VNHLKAFSPIKTGSLSIEVEKQLTNLIKSGVFKPDDRLPSENELAEHFQVSRSTVREALMKLRSTGLIEIKRGIHAGTYITEPSSVPITKALKNLIGLQKISFAQLIEVRLHFEPSLAGYAAILRTETDLFKLEQLLNSRQNDQTIPWKKARQVNINFHLELARIINNPVMLFLMESITKVYYNFLIDATLEHTGKDHVAKHREEHIAVLNAVRDQDAGEAHRQMKKHLLGTYYAYSDMLNELKDEAMEMRFALI